MGDVKDVTPFYFFFSVSNETEGQGGHRGKYITFDKEGMMV